MQYKSNTVTKLPTELCEMREAKKLLRQWGNIQKIMVKEERIAELAKWRGQMENHLALFKVC